ncbi:regulatory-associated protein of TOR 1 [Cucumis melo var. makuwa]|uniref:Regulatory-associated protein of TOR 1 n=1 Tax=Cucumis melo var. makuwa TaxID=1194695 RepID=A0A5A7SYE4_CUCMM|nr:regulatory-associated protein of TOR 1 [Cucumis melo var. makuwa]
MTFSHLLYSFSITHTISSFQFLLHSSFSSNNLPFLLRRVAGTTTTIVPRAQLVPATTAVTPHFLQTLMLPATTARDFCFRAETSIVGSLLSVVSDGSPLVRAEVAVGMILYSPCFLLILAVFACMFTVLSKTPESQHSDSGVLHEDAVSNGTVNHSRPKPLNNALYSQCVLTMCTLANDPSSRIASLGRRVLSIIGIEQVVTKPVKASSSGLKPTDGTAASQPPTFAGLARSSSWFDMNGGHLPLTFRTPPVSPPRPSYLTGMRRVCSLQFRPQLMNSPDSGLADPLWGSGGTSGTSERSFLPQSTIYNWSCGHFSKPLLTAADDGEEIFTRREEREKFALERIAKCQHSPVSKLNNNPIASWDTKFEMGTKTLLLQPFSPIVVAADENERIRVWNYEEPALLNSFDNHDFPEKGISKLCLVNELDDSLLLAASCDGNIRIWKDYTLKGKQKLVTAFSAIQGHKPGYASGEISSIMLWDLDKEQLVKSIPSSSDCSISALIVSASQAGDIQFLDIRNLTIDAHRGSLTALAVHRHAPILASGSAKQLIKVFSLDGDQLGTIRYHQQACFHCWWNQT